MQTNCWWTQTNGIYIPKTPEIMEEGTYGILWIKSNVPIIDKCQLAIHWKQRLIQEKTIVICFVKMNLHIDHDQMIAYKRAELKRKALQGTGLLDSASKELSR